MWPVMAEVGWRWTLAQIVGVHMLHVCPASMTDNISFHDLTSLHLCTLVVMGTKPSSTALACVTSSMFVFLSMITQMPDHACSMTHETMMRSSASAASPYVDCIRF